MNDDLENLYINLGTLLKDLRLSTGSTKETMAAALGVDKKTYLKYEAGVSSPDVPSFIHCFANLNHDALRSVLNFVYPDTYDIHCDSDAPALRSALIHYFTNVACDHEVREIDYLIFGGHGSNWRPQLEMFTMLDHLPLQSRSIVAALISHLYALAVDTGTLVNPDCSIPDTSVFNEGASAAGAAIRCGVDRYTTSSS